MAKKDGWTIASVIIAIASAIVEMLKNAFKDES